MNQCYFFKKMILFKEVQSYFLKKLWLLVQGVFMGIALIVPGTSAGTVAMILGLYSSLIQFPSQFFSYLLKKDFLKARHLFFSLFPILFGMIIGFLLTVRWIHAFVISYPVISYSFFSGVILGSIPFLLRQIKINTITFLSVIFCALVSFVFSLSVLNSIWFQGPLWFFVSVYISVLAMLLPGISGSYILVVTGSYSKFLTAFQSFSLQTIGVIFVAILSVLSGSRVIQYLLNRHLFTVMACLTGLTLGGGLAIFPLQSKEQWIHHGVFSILFFVIGLFLVFILHYAHSFYLKLLPNRQ